MEWIVWVALAGPSLVLIMGLVCQMEPRRKKEVTASPQPLQITSKAKSEKEAKDDWLNAFKELSGDGGKHEIVRTWYVEMKKKDGREWPSYSSKFWPKWLCKCGANGTASMIDKNFTDAEKRALKQAEEHIKEYNYIESKLNPEDGRAF